MGGCLLSLSTLVAAYINKDKEEKERDPERLFLSDIGKCPREVAYRMLQTKKDPRTPQEDINSSIMFDLAERIERNLIDTLDYEGLLIAEQDDVIMPDRENWGGRFDIIADYNGRRVIEVKSVYPGAFNYDLVERYPQHHHQANAYDHYCYEVYELDAPPLLSYWDRGGQNTPQEVDVQWTWYQTMVEMDRLDLTRDKLPELPNRLGKVMNLKSWYKDIILEPDGRCKKPYCKYTETCKQNMSTSCMASRENVDSPWVMKKAAKGNEEQLAEFMSKLALKKMEGK
jgi:hypothetical protein